MNIFIYFPKNSKVKRDVLEDAIDDILDGSGEITGGGTGNEGSNIDIEIFEGDPANYKEELINLLREYNCPAQTYIVIDNQKFYIEE